MWQSTWASSVVTRPVKMYHATTSKSRIATKVPFTKGFRLRIQGRNENAAGGGGGATGAAAALGAGVDAGGVELMIRFTSYFVYIASISPVARARASCAVMTSTLVVTPA